MSKDEAKELIKRFRVFRRKVKLGQINTVGEIKKNLEGLFKRDVSFSTVSDMIQEWSLEFMPILDKTKRKEIIKWLKQSCLFFEDLTFPDDIKLEVSKEVDFKDRKILFTLEEFIGNKLKGKTYIYIIKSGNTFSWVNYDPYLNRKKLTKKIETKDYVKETVFVKKNISHKEIKKEGITCEIFCKGDTIIPEIDQLFEPKLAYSYFTRVKSFSFSHKDSFPSGIPISIISGTPFEYKCTEPLVLIRIELDEIKKIFPSKDNFFNHFIKYMHFKFIIDRWKLLTQWINDTDVKILSILSLYFSGALPLQNWKILKAYTNEIDKTIKIKEEERNIRGGSFEKPRIPIAGFEVGESELVLFIGLTRQTIRKHIKGKKSIFKFCSKLKEIIKCELEQKNNYRFSTVHPENYFTANEIRELIFSSLSVKKI